MAQLWLESPDDRAAITKVIDAMDDLLASDPLHEGESRDNDHRVVFSGPLVFTIQVDVEHHLVRVLNVRYPKKRRSGH